MNKIFLRLIPQSFSNYLDPLRAHLGAPLYRNAYTLIVNQFAAAALGIVYWMLAARLYGAQTVGRNVALFSSVMILSTVAELGLRAGLTRYVPRAGARTPRLILATYASILVGSVIAASAFFIGGNYFFPGATWGVDDPREAIFLILATGVWSIFDLSDGVLTGMRQTVWVLLKNTLFNLTKMVLLIVGVQLFHEYGVIGSWFVAAALIVVPLNLLIFKKLAPQHIAATTAQASPLIPRQIFGSVAGDYVGTLLSEISVRVLPLLTLAQLGSSASAYFYQAWVFSTLLQLIASGMTNSFTVEASAQLNQIATHSRRILIQMTRLIVPAVAAAWIAAPFVLGLFGAAYAREGTALFRWLALAAIPFMLTTWYLSYARVLGNARAIIAIQGFLLVSNLGLAVAWLPVFGITGVGLAWFVSQTLAAGFVAWKTARLFLDTRATTNQLVRRADWRFLSSMPHPRKSVYLTDGALAQSVSAISEQVIDGRATRCDDGDLAVASNPNPVQLRAAYAALHSNGVCYTEWTVWRWGGIKNIRRRLKDAGFNQTYFYLPIPTCESARFWMPLSLARAPIEFLANQFLARHTRVHRSAKNALVHGLRWAVRMGWVMQVGVIAYKEESGAFDVCEFVRRRYATNRASATALSFLIRTGGKDAGRQMAILVFAEEDAALQSVIKLPRTPQDVVTLRREYDLLSKLGDKDLSGDHTLHFPRALFGHTSDGASLFGQSALAGVSLSAALTRANYDRLARQITAGLIDLARQTRAASSLRTMSDLAEPLLRNLQPIADSPADADLIAATRRALANAGAVPTVCMHGDFTPWNLFVMNDGIGAFDWGSGEWRGIPLLDLIYGLANLAFLREGKLDAPHAITVWRQLIDPSTALGKSFDEHIQSYVQRVGLSSDAIAPLRLLTWLLHASRKFTEAQIESGGRVSKRALRNTISFALWRTELEWQKEQAL